MDKKKLNAKDFINIGIFTVIYFVMFFITGMLGYIPIFAVIIPLVLGILGGIPFMLFLTKTDKFGMVTIMSIIFGVFWFLMGYTWTAIVGYVVFGIISDLVLRAGKYKSFKIDVIGYWLFSCGMIGCQAPMWVMADTYMAGIEQSMGAQYASELARYMPSWMGIAAIAIIFVGALLGSLLGHKMLKKHFERAGIV